jgi:hypothetical protein
MIGELGGGRVVLPEESLDFGVGMNEKPLGLVVSPLDMWSAVPGRGDEFCVVTLSHECAVDGERRDALSMAWRFPRIVPGSAAHARRREPITDLSFR